MSSKYQWVFLDRTTPARKLSYIKPQKYVSGTNQIQSNCPTGCPCNDFDCASPLKSLLVLNTYESENVPLLMDSNGYFKQIDFDIESMTEVAHSCSATINGEFFIFGGRTQKRQVSKIINCSLRRVGDLPYELFAPTCGTFEFPEERSMICFSSKHEKSCVRYCKRSITNIRSILSFDGHISYTHPNSTFTHHSTTLSSINNQVVAVGSWKYSGQGQNNKG